VGDTGSDHATVEEAAMIATPVLGSGGLPLLRGGLTRLLDSIVFPPYVRAHQDERRVRPALAVLFRIAVGPRADYYVRRFVQFEKSGRSGLSWNWPAFALGPVWAFYRKLWAYGVACALLPLVGALAFTTFDLTRGDSGLAWWACAAFFCWLLPAAASASFANSFYYRSVRRVVRRAEINARKSEVTAKRLLRRQPTDALLALLLGTGVLLLVGSLIGPCLQTAYHAHRVRAALEQVIAATRPLQHQVEEQWARSRAPPRAPDYEAVRKHAAYGLVAAVDLNARNGRVRIDLGSAVPELQGRSILLAPAVDAWQKLHWLCVPIDIPAAFVPASCAGPLQQ
jgi:hypothetical protein